MNVNGKLLKWVAAIALAAGAPAVGLARTHHVTTAAASPLLSAMTTTTPLAATPVAKVSSHRKSARHAHKSARHHVRKVSTHHKTSKARHRRVRTKKA